MTIQLLAEIDVGFAKRAKGQLPFIASKALNKTAVGARDEVKRNLPRRFKLRNHWTAGGIQARTSSKTNLVASIVAPSYMAIQEDGGQRKPNAGKMLAAPAFQTSRPIPKAERPKSLLARRKAFFINYGGEGSGIFERTGNGANDIKLLYWLKPTQDYEARFNFEQDIRQHVSTHFGANFAVAFAESMQ